MAKFTYLVGIDGSECAVRAAKRAVMMAEQTGADVKLVYVLDLSDTYPLTIEGYIPPAINEKEYNENIQVHVITPLLEELKGSTVEISTEIVNGDPVDSIRDMVKDEKINMVFVGRKGRSRIIDLLLGSVANKLAHLIGVPIVLVP